MSGPDYIVDIDGLGAVSGGAVSGGAKDAGSSGGSLRGRPWLAVQWKCCRRYSRIYRNRAGTAYEGRCPKCGAPVKAVIGEGGTSARFFVAD